MHSKDFSGESLTGKAAILWFWARWYSKCQREAPAVASPAILWWTRQGRCTTPEPGLSSARR